MLQGYPLNQDFLKISGTLSTSGKSRAAILLDGEACYSVITPYAVNTPILLSLTKNVDERPKFHMLATHPFIGRTEQEDVDVAGWYKDILQKAKARNAFLPPHVVVD